MAQTLDQVIASLGNIYDPQVQSVKDQQAAIPGQVANQETALKAQEDASYGDILNGARSRGLGFSGIPLAEQAKYNATSYLPALANLHTAAMQQQQSLTDAINKINEDRFSAGNNIYQFGVQQDFAQQQLAYQKAKDAADRAAAERAAAANSFNPSLGGGGSAGPSTPAANPLAAKALTGNKSQQDAYNAVKALLLTNNGGLINNTATAILKSAKNGNTYDQYKLQLLQQIAPQFYKGAVSYGGVLNNRPTF